MDEPQMPAPRTSSRTLAMVVVAVLIAVAVAGIMIAVLRGKPPAPEALSAAPASAPTSAPRAKLDADLNNFNFSGDSDQLTPAAIEQAKTLAESIKSATSLVVLTGKIETTSDRAARLDLAKKRVNAVRRALQGNGVSPTRFRVEIAEYPVGRVPAPEANRIEIVLR